MGGEKSGKRWCFSCLLESPPRGRGKETSPHLYCELSRITPAWAGKRDSQWQSRAAGRDHPRAGGEKSLPEVRRHYLLGSPPHGRGKSEHGHGRKPDPRITPAWAGKSLFCFTAAVPIQDRPRVGGEKTVKVPALVVPTGSPPRGRGKVADKGRPAAVGGITPAQAGKSWEEWRLRFR